MPRTPSDATRFTATGPYISTKPTSSSSPTSFTSSMPPVSGAYTRGSRLEIPATAPPANETPAQKIARLRAAAAAAKLKNEPSSDRIIRIGRIVADKAHRFTALGLMGFTVLAAMVAGAGITDMLMHNRRRRAEWLADKEAETTRLLAEAKTQLARGRDLTEEQRLLINRERVAREAEEEKNRRPGMWKRIFGGKEVDKAMGKSGAGEMNLKENGVLDAVGQTLESNRRQGEVLEEVARSGGGPLDRHAQLAADSVSSTNRSWSSWVMGR